MNLREENKNRLIYRLYNVVAFVVAFVCLWLLIPKESKFRYEFQKGKPWLHETLYATFDFAIDKSEEALRQEQDSVLQSFAPVYQVIDSVDFLASEELKNSVASICATNLPQMSEKDIDRCFQLLNAPLMELYAQGILEKGVAQYEGLQGYSVLKVVKDKYLEQTSVEEVHSLKTAYSSLLHSWKVGITENMPVLEPYIKEFSPSQFVRVNLQYDKESSDRSYNEILEQVSLTEGMVQSGERIVSQGELVDAKTNLILQSMKNHVEARIDDNNTTYVYIGRGLFLAVLLLVLFLYSFVIYRDMLRSKRSINLMFCLFLGIVLLSRVLRDLSSLDMYMVPVSLMPILVHTFIDKRVAIFSNTVLAVVIGYFAPNPYDYVLLQFVGGTVAVVALGNMQRRSHLIVTCLYIFLAYFITYFSIAIIQEGSIDKIDWSQFRWFAISSVLVMLVHPLGWICEKFFGFVSDITLSELSDTNQPLLRRLSQEAPGTFQHSTQVANIAEQVIMQIGGNPHLVRAGALYHDIGKIANSVYFTENQSGQISPHSKLTNEESAQIIIDHVDAGVQLAKKHGLPDAIINFIRTHHGTGKTGYFYAMSLKENDGKVDSRKFTYPGPAPFSKETAVVMLADGIEAASRSLPEKTRESLSGLIDKIIDGKMKDGQLDHAPLTLLDITKIKAIFLDKLSTVYHVRIAYPDEPKKG